MFSFFFDEVLSIIKQHFDQAYYQNAMKQNYQKQLSA